MTPPPSAICYGRRLIGTSSAHRNQLILSLSTSKSPTQTTADTNRQDFCWGAHELLLEDAMNEQMRGAFPAGKARSVGEVKMAPSLKARASQASGKDRRDTGPMHRRVDQCLKQVIACGEAAVPVPDSHLQDAPAARGFHAVRPSRTHQHRCHRSQHPRKHYFACAIRDGSCRSRTLQAVSSWAGRCCQPCACRCIPHIKRPQPC